MDWTGAGLLLTAGEIAYDFYLFLQPTELEVWMTRCVFRKRSLNGNRYFDEDTELTELAKARRVVGL